MVSSRSGRNDRGGLVGGALKVMKITGMAVAAPFTLGPFVYPAYCMYKWPVSSFFWVPTGVLTLYASYKFITCTNNADK